MRTKRSMYYFIISTMAVMFSLPVYGGEGAVGSVEIPEKKLFTFNFPDVDKFPSITALAISDDGDRILTGGDDCSCAVWDVRNEELIKHFKVTEDWVRGLVLSPEGEHFAIAGQSGEISIWNARTYEKERTMTDKVVGARTVAYSPNGKVLAVGGADAVVYLFDPQLGKQIARWESPSSYTRAVTFSADGSLLAAAGKNGVVRVWETKTGKVLYNLATDSRRVNALAFDKETTRLAAAGENNRILVWDLKTGNPTGKININEGKIYCMIFCGSDFLATGDSQNMIRVWNVAKQCEVGYANGHTGTVAVLFFDAKNTQLITGSFDTTVRFWDLRNILSRP